MVGCVAAVPRCSRPIEWAPLDFGQSVLYAMCPFGSRLRNLSTVAQLQAQLPYQGMREHQPGH